MRVRNDLLVAAAACVVALAALALAFDWIDGTRSRALVVTAAALVVAGVADDGIYLLDLASGGRDRS